MATAKGCSPVPPECDFATIADEQGLDAKISLRSGEFLFREGDEADALYIVVRGVLRVMSGSAVLETVPVGGIVGEMAIVDRTMPRSASVIAGTYSELIKIDATQFLALVGATPDFALMVMRVMARRLRVMNRRYRPQAAEW
jgi:CRP/FNR family transcriptional regulator, cyclic AMP receptor protein